MNYGLCASPLPVDVIGIAVLWFDKFDLVGI